MNKVMGFCIADHFLSIPEYVSIPNIQWKKMDKFPIGILNFPQKVWGRSKLRKADSEDTFFFF